MTLAVHYPTKKALKESVGQRLKFTETSIFGAEYKANGTIYVVGPTPESRKFFAKVTMKNDLIEKVE
jgi:hypothetical protein